jgi:hypothetical protein
MTMFISLAGHAAIAYLHFLLSWRFYPQRRDNYFVHLFWYLMILSLVLHLIYSLYYLSLLFELNGTIKYLKISGYGLLAFYPAILATLFLGELTEQPQKVNSITKVLAFISKDTKKLFIVCISLSIVTILVSVVTDLSFFHPRYTFGNLYAFGLTVIFCVLWLLMYSAGLRPSIRPEQFKEPTFGYAIAITVLLILSFMSYLTDLGRAWSFIPIISTTGLSLSFCWYRFRTQFMDVILSQFLRILMLITIVVGLSELVQWMNIKLLSRDVQMLFLFGYLLAFSLLFIWLNHKLTSLWHPSLHSLSQVHTELPVLLNQCTDIKSSTAKTEQYLSDLFSTQVGINRLLPGSVQTVSPNGEPKIEINLSYIRRWMPWFSEALNWVQTAGLYLQSHLKVLETIEREHIQQLKTQELASLAAKAELIAMRSQIRPHFLFNSLNSIHAFISSDPKQAERMIEKLADMIRGVLKMSDKDEVKLQQELDLVDNYIAIEKIRYGDKFKFILDIEQGCEDEFIPSFSIQPLVENAIKHAVDAQFEPVVLKVNVQKK